MKTFIFILITAIVCLMGALIMAAQELGMAIALSTVGLIVASCVIAYGSSSPPKS